MKGYAFAEVSVNSPIAQRRSFSYGIPENLRLNIGQAVWVPFGDKVLQGIVTDLTHTPSVAQTREIIGVIDPTPVLSPIHVSLSRWLSSYYLSPLFDSLSLMLPPCFERHIVTLFQINPNAESPLPHLNPDQTIVFEYIANKGKVNQKDLEKSFGVRKIRTIITQFISKNFVIKSYEMENIRVKPRMVSFISLKVKPDVARLAVDQINKRSVKQIDLLHFLIERSQPVTSAEARLKSGCTGHTISLLSEKGLVEVQEIRVNRDPLHTLNINLTFPLPLTSTQKKALQPIAEALHQERLVPSRSDVFLLHGVTGSGKTEIYIQALENCVKLGKKGIVLVPEISMTPQVIERFISRFPGKVAVLHSKLSLGERFDEWSRIRNGEFDVVIGSRSAIFAPQPDLGLIIIDEEHEWTYKQEDSPRYHTREVALKLAELTGAVVVLGSATPDVESYYQATHGEYHLLELPERVTPGEGSPLPQVEIVDLKAELKSGNLSLFSHSLHKSIESALLNNEQIILFLNRRGSASFIECRNCGWVIRCKRCEVPLSYHFNDDKLVCHQCNNHLAIPQFCPRCRSRHIKYLGVGTEKLGQDAAQTFPQARLLRWDSDVIQKHGTSHQEIYNQFKAGKADILIGTQMIAKGLDFPRVTTVGVVSADIALNFPDFRAGERAFQLLSQVAGRAGRGLAGGKVIIQTYSPEHYSIQAAAKHDYLAFYQKELEYRRELHYPPFSRMARLTFTHTSELHCREESEKMKILLCHEKDARGLADISFIGPAPAFIHRLRGKFRWQLILRSSNPSVFLSYITFPRGWTVDIDPVGIA